MSPGEATLQAILQLASPCVILIDETVHYVDKSSGLEAKEETLAKQTVAFVRELTEAVDSVSGSMLLMSLTASRMDQLSNDALAWLARLERQVSRVAAARTPIEGVEIHEIVRHRLFERVDDDKAAQIAERYHSLYVERGGLPIDKQSQDYQHLIERSFPFHPELVTVLYERWGAKPTFQLTRGTLRFLALALQDLWVRRTDGSPDLILASDISLEESRIRAFVREVAGEGQWESVIGSDIAAPSDSQLAKAQLIDQGLGDGSRLAEGLATTILLYSLSGGDNPFATRQDIRLACGRPELEDALCDDVLNRFRSRLFYFYFEDEKCLFRKEPNVLALQHSYRGNLEGSEEATAFVNKTIQDWALGADAGEAGFEWVKFRPQGSSDIPDDETLKLIVLDFDYLVDGGELTEAANAFVSELLTHRGQPLRQYRNTQVFCLADVEEAKNALDFSCEYKSWQKIQTSSSDWERIGGPQQELVKEELDTTLGATRRALIQSYGWAAVPVENAATGQLELEVVKMGAYGPGTKVMQMVWQRLAAETGANQHILKSLTGDTLLERYGARAWPESESWVTTAQVWERFTRQVGLPILAGRQVLLDALRLGQREGLLAIGHLNDDSGPRDQRDSYAYLFFEDSNMPPNAPEIGERWLVMRPNMHQQIANQPVQVASADVLKAIKDMGGLKQPVILSGLRNYVEKDAAQGNLDKDSFTQVVTALVKESQVVYRSSEESGDETSLPPDWEQAMEGYLAIPESTVKPPPPTAGRIITVKGKLRSLAELAPLFKDVLKPLDSQHPKTLSISLEATAVYDEDPGAGLTASLADGFDPDRFSGLTLEDSKRGEQD